MNRIKHRFSSICLALTLVLATVFAGFITTPVSAVPIFENDSNSITPDTNSDTNSDTTTDNNTDNAGNQPEDSAANSSDTDSETTTAETESDGEEEEEEQQSICAKQSGSLNWFVCSGATFLGSLIDGVTGILHEFFEVNTISTDSNSPVYLVWQYMRNLTNIIFIIFILIVIYSQLTGLGINNYGIKRTLPRIIIAVILVNLSFLICSLFIDVSNILGNSIIDFCQSIQARLFSDADLAQYSWGSLVAVFVAGGAGLALFSSFTGGLSQYFFMLLPILIFGAISVIIGLITIAARQALVALLVMVAPLAFIAYLLPNTEKYFSKWRELLARMLIFYPMFSFLVGASQLLGSALLVAATSPFGTLIGYAVQVVPIFFAFSLMKMSGTILGSLNAGLARLTNPINSTASGWATSHVERRRQNTILHSSMPGAHLRRFLDYRKVRRDTDTEHATKARQDMAADRALTSISGSLGYDKKSGRAAYRRRANRFTENAKLASYYNTRASTAKDVLNNTISEYADHFGGTDRLGRKAKELNSKHADAFVNAMSQKYLAANIAQGDQDFLLGKFLDASINRETNPEAYNRLIKSSASSLGHLGEASIMGQVISENARIEQRRRSEARIIANKFGIKKPDFRAMVFDCASIDDDGFETDENGKAIEDANYNLKPGAKHRPWQHFVAVHKDTHKEITAERYNNLSDAEKAHYRRVNFMNITDDQGKIVQQVFADDAGYMKELLTDDITIGDPITQRYAFSIGRGLTDQEKETLRTKYHVNIPDNYDPDWAKRIDDAGIMRKYHSSISTAILSSNYKEHNAAMTAMFLAQANNGYVRTPGQGLIGLLDSIAKSTKPGAFLKNDPYAIQTLTRIIQSVSGAEDAEAFENIIPNLDVETFLNVNGVPLHGLRWGNKTDKNGNVRLDENGQALQGWIKIDRTDSTITLEDRKNYIKHGLIPAVARKLVGMMDRNLSSGVLEGQKPGTYDELLNLLTALEKSGVENLNPDIDVNDKLDPDNNIFATHDPREMRDRIRNTKFAIQRKKQGMEDWDEPISATSSNGQSSRGSGRSNNSGNSGNSGSSGSRSRGNTSSAANAADLFNDALNRTIAHETQQASMNDIRNILDNIYNICSESLDLDSACDFLLDYLSNRSVLAPYYQQISDIINRYRNGTNVRSRSDIAFRIEHSDSYEDDLLQQMYHELVAFLQSIFVN